MADGGVKIVAFWIAAVTIPQTRSVRHWYGHWLPSLKYKKKPVWQTVVWPLALKKNRSVRLWYGLWRPGAKCVCFFKKNLVWQTVVWSLGLKKPGLTDRGVATGVTKFRMASGGFKEILVVFIKKLRYFLPDLYKIFQESRRVLKFTLTFFKNCNFFRNFSSI